MKLLPDECLPQDRRHLIVGHGVFTVGYMGWSGMRNGALLATAAAQGFDALLTTDAGIEHQTSSAARRLAIVVLHAPTNDLADLSPLVPELLRILSSLPPRTVAHVR